MEHLTRMRTLSAAILLTAGLAFIPQQAMAQTNSPCGQTIANDAKAVSKDLSAIATQAGAQGFNTAVEQFATDMEAIVPTLSRPSQDAVQKFVTDLENATSASGPGGTAITAGERLVLTNDWVILVTSTGATSAQIATISDDLSAVLLSLQGISTVQLRSDLNLLAADAAACADAHRK